MRTRLIIVGCVVLLGAAWWFSRTLVETVPPPAPVNADGPPLVARPATLEPVPAAPTTPPLGGAQLDAVINSQPQGPVQPALVQQPVMKEAPPPVDVAPSPFQGESRELDYAEELLNEPGKDDDRLISALEVMKRCLEQEPENERCRAGLERARLRLYPPPATTLPGPAPTLQVVPPQTLQKSR